MREIEDFLCKCIKYTDFVDAIHVVQSLSISESKEYPLLLGYLFMRNGEYKRAIAHLSDVSSFTSMYYQALCHKYLKEYTNAKYILMKMLKEDKKKEDAEAKIECGNAARADLEKLYVLERDYSFVSNMLGEIEILTGCYEGALKSYQAACTKNLYLYTGHRVILENTLAESKKLEREEENMNNIFSPSEKGKYSVSVFDIDKNISEEVEKKTKDKKEIAVLLSLLQESSLLKKISKGECDFAETSENLDRFPLYTVSAAAVHVFEAGYLQKAGHIFGYLRTRDPCYLGQMHCYSSILWQHRDKAMLGTLGRDLFGVDTFSPISWAVLGNYFSLMKETEKAVQCFERSLAIQKDPYVLCLLGHEHFMNSNLTESLKCFVSSIQMKSTNYNGIAGCGLIYEKVGKKESAEYCFLKAIRCNPQNVFLGYLAVKFLTSCKKKEQAYHLLQKYLHMPLSIEEVAKRIENNEWTAYLSSLASAQNEQIAPLLGFFLLELSCLLAYSGYLPHAEAVAREATGKGQSFSTRKSNVFNTIVMLVEEESRE